MLKFIWKNKKIVLGSGLGMIAGYAYWYYVGCASGSCPITANWGSSVAYGAFMGAAFIGLFEKKETE